MTAPSVVGTTQLRVPRVEAPSPRVSLSAHHPLLSDLQLPRGGGITSSIGRLPSAGTYSGEVPPLARFVVEREPNGSFVFSDSSGVMYGVGSSLEDAFEDWLHSAIELLDRLEVGLLHPRMEQRRRLLADLLR